jgi:hypothetical protein
MPNSLEHLAKPWSSHTYDQYGQEIIPGAKPADIVAAAKLWPEHIELDASGMPKTNVAEVAAAHGAVDFNYHSALSGADLHVRVAEVVSGGKQIFVGETPIASSVNLPGGGVRMQLAEIYMDGSKFKDIREAFVAAQEKLNLPPPYGSLAGHRLLFSEGGSIDVIHGAPGNPDAVQVLLNGKEIAKGLATIKGPKLTLDHTLHHNFLMADTVCDRAFKFLEKNLKLKTNASILKDLTLEKVVHK